MTSIKKIATRLAEVARLAECHRANAETNYEKWAAAEARIAELTRGSSA